MLSFAFILLVTTVFLGLLALVRRAGLNPLPCGAVVLAWLAAVAGLATAGVLGDFRVPPPFAAVVLTGLIGTAAFGLSGWGKTMAERLPLWLLVLSQAFRFPLELTMDYAREIGVMPPQMSFHGLNYDILTGISAIVVGLLVKNGTLGRKAVMAWNAVGFALLVNIVTIAVLSLPLPFRQFINEPANVWVTWAPYCWLPTFLVPCALLGHILVARALRNDN